MSHHIALGVRGEAVAAQYLHEAGLRIVERNWRCPLGELDIIAEHRGSLVFCEVKTRRSTDFGTPAEAVDDAKAARIRRLATQWRRDHGIPPCPSRFDIVSVLWPPGREPSVRHLVGVL